LLNPAILSIRECKRASTIKGAFQLEKIIHPSDLPKIDLIICGAVAISYNGIRIGKGSGYGEFEFAILREINKVNGNTPVIAIIHDKQLISEKLIPESFDLTVNNNFTPT